MEVKEKQQFLRFIGIKVLSQKKIEEAFSILQKYDNFTEAVQNFHTSSTRNNQDNFVNLIKNKHQEILTKKNDSEIILKIDSIFSIRAINPQQILSLTQRAFFNSFNLQRNNMNDLNQDPNRQYEMRQQRKRSCCEDIVKQRPFIEEEQQKCICGKIILGAQWVQCIYQEKCRGSNWYHMQCAGFTKKDMEKIKDTQFVCDTCKRQNKEDDSGNSSKKRRKVD